MGNGRVSGGAAIGCGGLSLLGVLVGVGLVVWLGAVTLSDRGPAADDGAAAAVGELPGAAVDPEIEVAVSPAEGLVGDDLVRVTAGGFEAGTEVTIGPCGPDGLAPAGGPDPCEADHEVVVTADADGEVEATLVVPRVLLLGALPYDCAAATVSASCRIRVAGRADAAAPVLGEADLRYAAGLPPPALPGLGDSGP